MLIIEGLPLFLAPMRAHQAALQVARLDSRLLRIMGLVLMVLGAGLLLLMRS